MKRAFLFALALSTAAAAQETDVPRREARRLGLALEGGYKNIAGYVGMSITYHALPRFSVSSAVGAGPAGVAIGVRGRWNLFRTALTPFLGGGFLLAGGGDAGGQYADYSQLPRPEAIVTYSLEPVLLLQAVAGVEWIARGGFTLRIEGGYSLTTGPHYSANGPLPKELVEELHWKNGSSPMGGFALGWTF